MARYSRPISTDIYSRHADELPLDEILIPTLKHWYAFQIVYPVAIGLVKFSILAQYHRIFVKRGFRNVVIGVGVFVLTYTIVVIFVNVSLKNSLVATGTRVKTNKLGL